MMKKTRIALLGSAAAACISIASPAAALFGPACVPVIQNCMCTYIMPCPVSDNASIAKFSEQVATLQEQLQVIEQIQNPKEMLMMTLRGQGSFQIPGMSSIGIDINGLISGDLSSLGLPAGVDINMIRSLASGDISPNTFMSLAGAAGVDIGSLEGIGLTPATLSAIANGDISPDMFLGVSGSMGITPEIQALHDGLSSIGIDDDMISAIASGELSPSHLVDMAAGAGVDMSQLESIGLSMSNMNALAGGSLSAPDMLGLASNLGLQDRVLTNMGIDEALIQDIARGSESVSTLVDRARSFGLSDLDLASVGLDASALQALDAGMSPEGVMSLLQRTGFDKSPLTQLGIDAGMLGQIASGQLPPEALNILASSAGLDPSAIVIPGVSGSISAPSSGDSGGNQNFLTIPSSSVPGLDNVLEQARGGAGGSFGSGGSGPINTCSAADPSGTVTAVSPSMADSLRGQGFDDDYVRAAGAIFGGESGGDWSINESHNYSPDRAREIFPSTLSGASDAEINSLVSQGPDAFFERVYGAGSGAGSALGNTHPGDGAKYKGRSWLQLTGRANYERYATLTGHDIVGNPDLLTTDPQVSADVAAAYLADRVDRTGDPVADVRAAVAGSRTGLGYSMNIDEDRARFASLGGGDLTGELSVYGSGPFCSVSEPQFPTPEDAMCEAEDFTLISTDIPPNGYGADLPTIDMAISGGTLEAFPESITAVEEANKATAVFGFGRSVTSQSLIVKAMQSVSAFEQMMQQTETLQHDFTVNDTIQAQLMTARAESASMLTALISMQAAQRLNQDVLAPVPLFPQNSRFEEVIEETVGARSEEERREAERFHEVATDHSQFTRTASEAIYHHKLIGDAISIAETMPAVRDTIWTHEELKTMQATLEEVIRSRLAQLYADPDAAWDVLLPLLYQESGNYLDPGKYDEGFADSKSLSQSVTADTATTAFGERLYTMVPNDEGGGMRREYTDATETPYAYSFIDANGDPIDEPYRIKPRSVLLIGGGGDDTPYMPEGYDLVGAFQYYLELVRRTQFYAELRRGDTETSMTSRFWNEMITNASHCVIGPFDLVEESLLKRPEMFDLSPDCDHLTWSWGDAEDYIDASELGGADAALWVSKITLDQTQRRTGGPDKVMEDIAAVLAYAEENDLLDRMDELGLPDTIESVEQAMAILLEAMADAGFTAEFTLPRP